MTSAIQTKRVSIVLCSYNGEKYIQEQLESIIHQTYPIYELIIQDDCSTDKTAEIVKEYTVKYPFIKLYKNKEQLGITKNFYSALYRASGDYIAISDQDDIWEYDKIENQVAIIGNAA